MPKIPATLEQTLRVGATMQEVYDIFINPKSHEEDYIDLESLEDLGDGMFRFVAIESNEKNIRFQAKWTAKYEGNGTDLVTWNTNDDGNMDVNGSAKLRSISDNVVEIHFKETLQPDLPINAILAKVFKPLVARSVKKGITGFLENVADNFDPVD